MPGYIKKKPPTFYACHDKILTTFSFAAPKPVFGQTQQFTFLSGSSTPLNSPGIKHVQDTIGVILYHAQALSSPLLAALNTLGTNRLQLLKKKNTLTQLLDYFTIPPSNPSIRCKWCGVTHSFGWILSK